MTKAQNIALITFGLFTAEAIIHYNLGRMAETGEKKVKIPPTDELVKIAGIVGIFSLASAALIERLA